MEKRKNLATALALSAALLLAGCGVTQLTLSPAEPTSAVIAAAGAEALAVSEEQTRSMCSYMLSGRFTHQDRILYGSRHDETGAPYLCRMKFTAGDSGMYVRETEVIERGADAQYLTLSGDWLYYLRTDCAEGGTSVCRVSAAFGSSGQPETVYAESCDFLFLHGGRLYLTDETHHLLSMEQDGSDRQAVLSDKEIYYPYLLSDNLLLYQDDADSESLHMRYLPTGFDLRVAEGRVTEAVAQGGELYFLREDRASGQKTLCRVNLNAFLQDFDPLQHPDAAYRFTLEEGPTVTGNFLLSGGELCMKPETRVPVTRWTELSAPEESGEAASCCMYASEDFEIWYDYNAEGLIESMRFYEPAKQRSGYIERYLYQ